MKQTPQSLLNMQEQLQTDKVFTYHPLVKMMAIGLLSILRWYAMSFMMSFDHAIKSRILLLGDDLSTFHFNISLTSSLRTLCNYDKSLTVFLTLQNTVYKPICWLRVLS